jgi:nucleoside-diphosphate-sugar epimerase
MTQLAARPLLPLKDLVKQDLDRICKALESEFAAMAGQHLLVTGGAGFLGYYLVQAALHAGRSGRHAPIHVTVWDNFARGRPEWLDALSADEHLYVQAYDLTQPLPASMPAFDWIVHAAGIASPTYYRKKPLETMDANITGLRNLLEYAARRGDGGTPLGGFLFFSSSEIYGDPDPAWVPTPEHYRGNVSCTGPRACYDESKRYGETLCTVFAQHHGVPVKMARPFNNYGPGLKLNDRRVIPDFARDVLAGRDIVMFSDGSPRRTYCYATDAITGYFKVLVRGRPGEPYNVGVEGPEISVAELAERVVTAAAELFDYRGRVRRQSSAEAAYLVDNPVRRCPDIRKARAEIGYAPSVSIDEGLRRALTWYAQAPQGSER